MRRLTADRRGEEVRTRRRWAPLILVGAFLLYLTFRVVQMSVWFVQWLF